MVPFPRWYAMPVETSTCPTVSERRVTSRCSWSERGLEHPEVPLNSCFVEGCSYHAHTPPCIPPAALPGLVPVKRCCLVHGTPHHSSSIPIGHDVSTIHDPCGRE